MHNTTTSPEELRAAMAEKVRKAGHAQCSEVERVLHDIPRQEFVPDADLAVAYDCWRSMTIRGTWRTGGSATTAGCAASHCS